MKLLHRVRRLEEVSDVSGCRECRDRRGCIVFTREVRTADGTVVEAGERPAPCPRCGQVAEQILCIVEVVVSSREELMQPQASRELEMAGAECGQG
jgi:hypothetical protein